MHMAVWAVIWTFRLFNLLLHARSVCFGKGIETLKFVFGGVAKPHAEPTSGIERQSTPGLGNEVEDLTSRRALASEGVYSPHMYSPKP